MELTKEVRSKAQELNSRIIANAQIAAESIVRVGQDLKIMRDEKLYSALGYGDFEAYCKLGVNIGQREAYNFIRCFETYGEQLAGLQHLGITKLTAMLALDSEERGELIESGAAEQMSVRELKQRVKELQQKNEQLTLDLGEKSKEESKLEKMRNDMEKLQAELAAQKDIQTKKDERIKELEAKPVEVAVEKPSKAEIAEIEKKAAEKAKKAVKKQHDKELAELREKSESERRAAVEAEQKKYLAEIERLRKRNTDLQSSAKSPAPNPDDKKQTIKFYIAVCLQNFNSALAAVNNLPEDERAKPLIGLKTMVEKMGGLLE